LLQQPIQTKPRIKEQEESTFNNCLILGEVRVFWYIQH
jgi:hypothetical protein